MPTRDDIYRKFGEASEAAQLVELELGTMLLFFGSVAEDLITPTLDTDKERITKLLEQIHHYTFGRLVKTIKGHTEALDQFEAVLSSAVKERNRLSHHFFRQHNLRINTEAGRLLMLDDLESIHGILIKAYKLLSLATGIDLDAASEQINLAKESGNIVPVDETKIFHLPI